jgi:hypothetical protein
VRLNGSNDGRFGGGGGPAPRYGGLLADTITAAGRVPPRGRFARPGTGGRDYDKKVVWEANGFASQTKKLLYLRAAD